MKHLNIRVTGDIGSNFREAAKNKATELGVKGLVRKDSDSSIFIEVEHEEGWKVDSFLVWVKSSSPGHPKDSTSVHGNFSGYEEFKIEY